MLGTQWGDEGKAKLIDLLAGEADVIVRYQGGHNAGHTVVVDGQRFAFRLVPSGMLHPGKTTVIGNGVVVDPVTLIAELDMLAGRGIDTSGLQLSANAHLILPHHPIFDTLAEEARGANALGTTRNGIGPAYQDKAGRIGLRVQDLLDPTEFRSKLNVLMAEKNAILTKVYGREPLDADAIATTYLDEYAPRLIPLVADTVDTVHTALEAGKHVLFEGAQATFLDIDHGTYPFVTSSNPVAGFACVGAGVGPRHINRVVGIAKAYVTRVGAGPFPTELHDETGELLQERGREFGTVTGRRRRCGWLDLVMLRQAIRLNGLTELAVTKLDILDVLPIVKICTAYEIDGQRFDHMPLDLRMLARAVPIYEQLPGWESDLTEIRHHDDLPANARRYLGFIGETTGANLTYVGVGAERDQVVPVAGIIR